jgi:hypothetical protein
MIDTDDLFDPHPSLQDALISSGNADSVEEAQQIISELSARMYSGECPIELLEEYGLEPDYILDLFN